jgi:hypothetical protein
MSNPNAIMLKSSQYVYNKKVMTFEARTRKP